MATQETSSQRTPEQFITGLIGGFWLSRAVAVAARLGLADHIGTDPRAIADLAAETSTDSGALYRLMRALAAHGIFVEVETQVFAHTPLSELFKSDVPGSLRYTAISELDTDHYAAWSDLLYSIQTGAIAFDAKFGMPVWRYYMENQEVGKTFEQSMTGLTQQIHDAILEAYSFAAFRNILDIGGGEGYLLRRILNQNPKAKGVVFDQPKVIELASEALAGDPIKARVTLTGGDFFESVPAGADLHLMKWIIHDWNDQQALDILRNCRRSLAPNGRLLLFELVIPPGNEGGFPKLLDLNMLVMTGGRERTEAEYRTLLASAGFRLTRVIPTRSPVAILEAEPV